jgi:hypothetical protein
MIQQRLEAQFPWWAAVADGEPDAARHRARAWLDGPYARVSALVRYCPDGQVDELLALARTSIDVHGTEPWTEPVEFEAWLRGLLQGCAQALETVE